MAHKHKRPPLFIDVPASTQESDRSCICVLCVSILPRSTILSFILEFFLQCGVFVCYFIN